MSALTLPRLMALGIGALRLSPPVFWSMSLPELVAALGPAPSLDAPDRTELDALMRRFPDTRPTTRPDPHSGVTRHEVPHG